MSRISGVPYQVRDSGYSHDRALILSSHFSQGKGTFNGSDHFISDAKMRDSGIGVFRTVETTEYSYESGRRVRDSVV